MLKILRKLVFLLENVVLSGAQAGIVLRASRELKIRCAAEYFLRNSIEVFGKPMKQSRVFDISFQSKQKRKSKRKSKIVKIYANKDWVAKHLHVCDFCFVLTR